MHPQLQGIEAEFLAAQDRLNRLAQAVAAEHWRVRRDPARWSVAECVAHLNLTSRAYLAVLDDAVARARALGGAPPRRYRRDFAGWALWRSLGPPARFRFSRQHQGGLALRGADALQSVRVFQHHSPPPAQAPLAGGTALEERETNHLRIFHGWR